MPSLIIKTQADNSQKDDSEKYFQYKGKTDIDERFGVKECFGTISLKLGLSFHLSSSNSSSNEAFSLSFK
jgi:hypothetical protein